MLNPAKHFKLVETEYEGQTQFRIENDIYTDSIKITSGEKVLPTQLIKDTDFTVGKMDLHGDGIYVAALEFLNTSKIVDGKFKVTYRKTSTALGGEPVVENVQLTELEDNIWELTDDTILESVTVETGGVDTLVDIPFVAEKDSLGATVITIPFGAPIVDGKVKLSYKEIDVENITAEDVIGGTDAATGQSYGLELVDSVFQKWNMVPGILIAPKFSLDNAVKTALAAKAKAVSGIFPAVAVVDIDTAENKFYRNAIEYKNENNITDCHLICCYPKVLCNGVQYYLSTHLAGLMNRVDAENNDIPYVSPSNKELNISAAVLADGTELFFNRDIANALNENGIVTVFAFNGLKAWGNYTAAAPLSTDPREVFIPVRRVFNFLTAILVTNYISKLDHPINRRMIEGLLHSANIYLNSLTAQGVLLGGRLEFRKEDNTTTNLMNGILNFRLYVTPPSPAQALIFKLEIDTDYYAALIS